MKVSKNSWHYQLMREIRICNPYERTNLCSYIRGILFSIFIPIGLVLAPLVLYLIYPQSNGEPTTVLKLIEIVFFFTWGLIGSIIDGIILLIIGVDIGVEYYNENIKPYLPKRKRETKIYKLPNIFIEYLKAKKKKICPIIEFIEE